jgi:hypothetical protein
MKMTTEHYNALKSRVATFTHQLPAHLEKVKMDSRCKDIETRMLFDIFHGAKMWSIYSYQQFDYTSEHIQTAMKRIAKELNIKVTH